MTAMSGVVSHCTSEAVTLLPLDVRPACSSQDWVCVTADTSLTTYNISVPSCLCVGDRVTLHDLDNHHSTTASTITLHGRDEVMTSSPVIQDITHAIIPPYSIVHIHGVLHILSPNVARVSNVYVSLVHFPCSMTMMDGCVVDMYHVHHISPDVCDTPHDVVMSCGPRVKCTVFPASNNYVTTAFRSEYAMYRDSTWYALCQRSIVSAAAPPRARPPSPLSVCNIYDMMYVLRAACKIQKHEILAGVLSSISRVVRHDCSAVPTTRPYEIILPSELRVLPCVRSAAMMMPDWGLSLVRSTSDAVVLLSAAVRQDVTAYLVGIVVYKSGQCVIHDPDDASSCVDVYGYAGAPGMAVLADVMICSTHNRLFVTACGNIWRLSRHVVMPDHGLKFYYIVNKLGLPYCRSGSSYIYMSVRVLNINSNTVVGDMCHVFLKGNVSDLTMFYNSVVTGDVIGSHFKLELYSSLDCVRAVSVHYMQYKLPPLSSGVKLLVSSKVFTTISEARNAICAVPPMSGYPAGQWCYLCNSRSAKMECDVTGWVLAVYYASHHGHIISLSDESVVYIPAYYDCCSIVPGLYVTLRNIMVGMVVWSSDRVGMWTDKSSYSRHAVPPHVILQRLIQNWSACDTQCCRRCGIVCRCCVSPCHCLNSRSQPFILDVVRRRQTRTITGFVTNVLLLKPLMYCGDCLSDLDHVAEIPACNVCYLRPALSCDCAHHHPKSEACVVLSIQDGTTVHRVKVIGTDNVMRALRIPRHLASAWLDVSQLDVKLLHWCCRDVVAEVTCSYSDFSQGVVSYVSIIDV